MRDVRIISISHDALVSWPPLAAAIAANVAVLREFNQLSLHAIEWDRAQRDSSYLLRGSRLANLDEAVEYSQIEPNQLEREFLRACHEQATSERGLFKRLLGPSGDELQRVLQNELKQRGVQLRQQLSVLHQQQGQLREQAARLEELAQFERQSTAVGGVFVSYSHSDNDVVDGLTARFERDRINYWRDDKDLLVGDVIDEAISRGIHQSILFLIVLTPNSITSRWVHRELDEAAHEEVESGKVVLPVLAKNLPANEIPLRLRRKLYVDLSGQGFESGYQKLATSIRRHIGQRQLL